MAQARVFLECRDCGEAICFWKDVISSYVVPSMADLEAFMNDHLMGYECDAKQGADPLSINDNPCVFLRGETIEDWDPGRKRFETRVRP